MTCQFQPLAFGLLARIFSCWDGRDPVRVAGADVDRLAAGPVAGLDPVRLAAVAPAERLVAEHQGLVHGEAGHGQEEPLPLAAVGGVLAAVAGLGPEPQAGLGDLDLGGLERLLGLPDGAHRGALGDGGDEPVPLVVAAEELVLLAPLPDHQQQVPVGGLDVQDGDLGVGASGRDDLEELAAAVGLDVQREDARAGPETAGRAGRRP